MEVKTVKKFSGATEPFDVWKLKAAIAKDAEGLNLELSDLIDQIVTSVYDGITTDEIRRLVLVEANTKVTPIEPDWARLAARTLMQGISREVTGRIMHYPHLRDTIVNCVNKANTHPDMVALFEPHFDRLNAALNLSADFNFEYLGLQTLYDRYLLRDADNKVIELPQHFFMRVAMGHATFALGENPTPEDLEEIIQQTINLYQVYSNLEGLSSTPTLFNSGSTRPQMSSCFIMAAPDDTDGIMETMREAAQNSKFAGGIGMSFSRIRANGSRIKATGGKAGGPIRYKRILQEVLKGFDQSGKRKGSGSSWLAAWHPQFLDHLNLWNKSGDENERTHYIFPANWVPSLLIERWLEARNNAKAIAEGTYTNPMWSFICPSVAPELMDIHGEAFKERYEQLEAEGKFVSQIAAFDLVSKMLNAWYMHGVFWTGFKDTISLRYPMRDHYTVDSSNLCTEVIGRANQEVSTVCNLSSPNLSKFKFDIQYVGDNRRMEIVWNDKLAHVVRTMVTALDSVIDCGWVPHARGREFNHLERMVGLGEMGLTECMAMHGIRYDSREGVQFSNEVKRQIAITAIWTSINLAKRHGPFPDFHKSRWAQGELPMDNAFTKVKRRLFNEFGIRFDYDSPLGTEVEMRLALQEHGIRNSALLATAPTATISNIAGTTACRELPFEDVTIKQNLSGDFEVYAPTLKHDPTYPLAYDVDPLWTIYHTAVAQLWTDQAISTNVYLHARRVLVNGVFDGEVLQSIYELAYLLGVKTLYYMYSQSPDSADVGRTLKQEAGDMSKGQSPFDAASTQATPGAWDCSGCQ